MLKGFLLQMLLVSLMTAVAWARPLPNIAVLSFTGDKTVSSEQLQFITGKFSAYLVESETFTVLDRSRMDDILKEQGFQQSGACNNSECRVQVGQLLGVDNLVAGSLVRFGNEYAFRIEYLDVSSGRIIKTIEFEKTGELQDVYKEACRFGADQLSRWVRGEKPTESIAIPTTPPTPAPVVAPVPAAPLTSVLPLKVLDAQAKPEPRSNITMTPTAPATGLSLKRKIALGLLGPVLIGGIGGLILNNKVSQYVREYQSAESSRYNIGLENSYDNWEHAKANRDIAFGISGISVLAAAILWFLPEGK
jgi:Curli production assembly/transport component CsgG